MERVVRGFNRIIAVCLFVAAAVVLAVSTLTTIYYDMHMDVDWPQYGKENIPLLLGLVAGVMVVLLIIARYGSFGSSNRWSVAALVIIAVYCLTLIFAIRPRPVDDSMLLDEVINQFVDGDYSSLTEPGGYLFTWPFQLGYVGFGQIMARIFGKSNYLAWDLVQLISIIITVFLIYRITWELFEDEATCRLVSVLSLGALFFYNYVTFIYGDILSMAPQTLSIYLMVLYLKRENFLYGLGSAASIAVAIVLKSNCEIALIALVMVLIGSCFVSDDRAGRVVEKIVLAVIFLVFALFAKKGVDTYYCNLTGLPEIPGGSPAWSHIAMGLQESELEDGWYNGYNYRIFAENGYDTELTGEVAKADILRSLGSFVKRPLHGAKFFVRKFATQWADSVCISTHNLDLVSRHVENQPKLCEFLVFGQGSVVLIWIMNVFMPVCYIGVAIYLFGIIRKNNATDFEMLILILIFGGILFHEFWEGSSRYAMRYYIYWLPYAAYGLRKVFLK